MTYSLSNVCLLTIARWRHFPALVKIVSLYYNVAWVEAYLHTKWHLDTPSRLAQQTCMDRKSWGSAPFFGDAHHQTLHYKTECIIQMENRYSNL